MKILLLTKYSRMGASSRLRSFQFLPHLEQQGFEITVQTLFSDSYLIMLYSMGKRSALHIVMKYLRRLVQLLSIFRYDLIWIEKEIFPYMPAIFEKLLHLFGKPIVVDYDDAIFHNYDRSSHSIIRKFLHRKIDTVMYHARYVLVGNEYLAARARAAGANQVILFPTVVDHTRYEVRRTSETGCPVIGWIGSPSTQQYVVEIRDALAEVCRIYGARLILVGANPEVIDELPGIDVDVVAWSEDTEAEWIRKMDIGIMPLPDGPWEKGKCGYKLIQYMACGVPIVASPVGVNVDIVTQCQCGFLATSPAEWGRALCSLLDSANRRSRMGISGRQAVENNYCLAVQAPKLSGIFRNAISRENC